jgi:acyl-lipid omega-6 desaturase (Delta-12 desaturase)
VNHASWNDSDPSARTTRELSHQLINFRGVHTWRSIVEIAVTVIPLAALWTLMWLALDVSYWLSLLLAIPTAGFMVRLFMIQHDCGHGAFFERRSVNDWVGRAISVVTLTPYDFWKRTHAVHHATAGNLERRGIGDIDTLTVREYIALSPWQRRRYRIYRNPAVMFGVGPAYLFLMQHRFPVGLMGSGVQPWLSTMGTNAAIACVAALAVYWMGFSAFLLVYLPVTLIASSIGVWLFYVQHQFEATYWTDEKNWSHQDAALHGSSYYDLPGVLRWFTANIGIHHIHHLSSRIPFYRLPEALRAQPELAHVGRVTLLQSLSCVRLALWDEEGRKLISFRDLRRMELAQT